VAVGAGVFPSLSFRLSDFSSSKKQNLLVNFRARKCRTAVLTFFGLWDWGPFDVAPVIKQLQNVLHFTLLL